MRQSRTSGVLPIVSRMESRMSVPASVSRVLMSLRVCLGRSSTRLWPGRRARRGRRRRTLCAVPAGWTSAATSAQNTTNAAMPVTIPRSRSWRACAPCCASVKTARTEASTGSAVRMPPTCGPSSAAAARERGDEAGGGGHAQRQLVAQRRRMAGLACRATSLRQRDERRRQRDGGDREASRRGRAQRLRCTPPRRPRPPSRRRGSGPVRPARRRARTRPGTRSASPARAASRSRPARRTPRPARARRSAAPRTRSPGRR